MAVVYRRSDATARATSLNGAGRVVAAALLGSLLLAATPAVARSITIERFDAHIAVESDASVTVTEEIRFRFDGEWNGIIRSIPVEYRTPNGFNYSLLLGLLSVTDDRGNVLERETSRRGHYREFKIWIPGANDAVRGIVLRYRVRNALRFFERHDELYWNVTGDEWEYPILAASARVTAPPGAGGLRANAFTGAFGSTERAADVVVGAEEARVSAQRPLGFREGLTIVVGWDKGAVKEPGPLGKALLFVRSNWPLGFPLLAFAVLLPLWHVRGRDPRLRPISVRYEPPAELSPAEVGTLVDNFPDMPDLTATLVDLAVRGHVEIEEQETTGFLGLWSGRDYLFRRRAPERVSPLRPHEQELLEDFFGGAGETRLSALENRFYRHIPGIRDRIFEGLMAHRYYDHRPDHVKRLYLIAAAAIAGAALFAAPWLSDRFGIAALTFTIAGFLGAAVIAGFGWFMPARTVAGARALEEVLGFQEFLDRVESDRFERVPQTPETFEKYLPYAMALGVEQNWAKAFEGIYREPPKWYRGSNLDGFRSGRLAADLGRMSARAATLLASAPRQSGGSGFGGGGRSGGGFGGGGGRGF